MIDNLFHQSGRLNLTVRPGLQELLDELLKLTDFYPGYIPKLKNNKDKNGDIICRVKIYKEKLTIKDLTCKNIDCDNFVNYEFQKQLFTDYCCKKCKSNSSIVKDKIANTLESKYGIRTLGGNKLFRKRAEATMFERYGVKNALHSKILKNKAKYTLGVDNASQLNIKNYEYWNNAKYIEDNFLDDKKQILVKEMCEFFNCAISMPRDRFIKLDIDFISERYKDIKNYDKWNDKKFIEDNGITKNNLINYNFFTSYFNVNDSRAIKKINDLNIEYVRSIYKNITNYEHYFDRNFIVDNFVENKFVDYQKMCNYFNIDNNTCLRKTKELDIQSIKNIYKNIKNYEYWNNAKYIEDNFLDDKKQILVKEMCEFFNCQQPAVHRKVNELNINYTKRKGNSETETEIINFLNESSTIQGDRKLIGKELDILVPDKFAIEYHGLMFHSHGISKYSMFNNPIVDMNKHLVKTELCESKNIQLFQIFENEWHDENKQRIWKSVINSKLNKTNRIYARKCVVKEVSSKNSKKFERENHLQGDGSSSIRYGLYYNDELVSLMTFKKHFKYEWELNRFCSKLNNTIIGGASKLLKHFERTIKPNMLLSYANRRWSTGNLYNKLDFVLLHNSVPNYFYFHNDDKYNLKSRVSFQKHKLSKKLESFDSKLSETTNMYNNNYRKIYDAGNMVFLKTYNK